MSVRFFVGLHQPADAQHFDLSCISINRLRGRRKPIECDEVLVDSGAFTELNLYGGYRHGIEEYAAELHRLYTAGVVKITAAVAQDYMCEPFMLAKTGLTIADHQRLTIERYDALKAELDRMFGGECPFPVMPVLQGYAPSDYVRHLAMYGDRLKPGMWIGVGSVCKRNGDPEAIVEVLTAIHRVRPDLLLHGFGVKQTALEHPAVRELLATADSMAWSFAARKQGRDGNSWQEAKTFAERVQQTASRTFRAWQLPLPLWRAALVSNPRQRWLDPLHALQELRIVPLSVGAPMDASMAVRAKRYHVSRVIRSAVAEAANMVRLQVRDAIRSLEWCRRVASLAVPIAAGNHIVPYAPAALHHGHLDHAPAGRQVGRLKSRVPHSGKRCFGGVLLLNYLVNVLDRPKLENDRLSLIAFAVWRRFKMVSLVDILAIEHQAIWRPAEKQQGLSLDGMVGDRGVTADHLHGANLPLAEVLENAVFPAPIGIAVSQTFLASDDDHQGMLSGGDDPALLLSSKPCMNVGAPVIDPPALKSPSHRTPQVQAHSSLSAGTSQGSAAR